MADEKNEPHGLPGSQIVDNFSDNIRNTIADSFKVEQNSIRKLFSRWSMGTLVGAAAVAAGVSWFINPPGHSAMEWTIRHVDGMSETCAFAPDSSDSKPSFVCHSVAPPAPPPAVPSSYWPGVAPAGTCRLDSKGPGS